MTGRTFSTGLFSIAAATVCAFLFVSDGQHAAASSAPQSWASASLTNFSTWIPRKGKMSYERDAVQADYGQGRNRIRNVTCAQLPKFVGPNGGAMDEDVVVVTTKGSCQLDGLLVSKAVTIQPASEVATAYTSLEGMRFSAIAERYKQSFDCSGMTSACITTNVGIGKTVIIKDFHIFTDKPMMAPLVESRSGGLVLRDNLIMGAVMRDEDDLISLYEQPAIVLAHGSHVALNNNIIARASVGVMLIPTQITAKSRYVLTGNIVAQVVVGVQAAGTTFMSSDGPMAKVILEHNYINPALRYTFDSAVYGPQPIPDDDMSEDQELTPHLPDDDLILGLDVSPPQYGVFAIGITLKMTGNSFGSSENHVHLQSSKAFIEQNIFRGAERYSINPLDQNQISINRNLFDSNDQVVYDIGYAFESWSPFPTGNVCVNQDFRSFHRGASNVTGYISTASGYPKFAFVANKRQKISSRDLRRFRKANPEMWAAYENMGSLNKASAPVNPFLPSASTTKEKSKSRNTTTMWDVFRTFYQKQQEPVMAHILFDREDVTNSDTGLYRPCFDYSTLYKFASPVDVGDNPFVSADE